MLLAQQLIACAYLPFLLYFQSTQRGERFAEVSETSREQIARLGHSFVRDGTVVLTHGYSRCALHLLLMAAETKVGVVDTAVVCFIRYCCVCVHINYCSRWGIEGGPLQTWCSNIGTNRYRASYLALLDPSLIEAGFCAYEGTETASTAIPNTIGRTVIGCHHYQSSLPLSPPTFLRVLVCVWYALSSRR